MSRVLARLGVLIGLGVALSVGFASSAGAHVTVRSAEAVQGGHAEIEFRVPTESDTARTVKLQVALPTDTPLAAVSVQPHPGWTYKVTNTSLPAPIADGHGGTLNQVVGQIEWTAVDADTAIKPGEYETFRIAAGPLPKTDRLIFKVLQTYDDGNVVRWIDQPAAAGAAAPEHPAAVLPLTTTAGVDVAHAGHVTAAATSSTGTPAVAWWTMAVTGIAVLAALWAVVISVRSVRRKEAGDVTTT